MKFDFLSDSEAQTRRFGFAIGEALLPQCVVTLEGDLGAGKTRLVQAICEGLGIDRAGVNSPTYTICVPHEGRLTLLHVDAYRIKDLTEVDLLALDEHIDDGCVLMVEWPSRIAAALPAVSIKVSIEHMGRTQRKFELLSKSPLGESVLNSVVENLESGL